MRYFFFVLLILSVGFATEQTLQWDNYPNPQGQAGADNYTDRVVVDYTAPYQCHISKLQVRAYYPQSVNPGNTTAYVYNDSSGYPGTLLGQLDFTNIYTNIWQILDIGTLGIVLNNGQKFYVGVKYAPDPWIMLWGWENTIPNHLYYAKLDSATNWTIIYNRDLLCRAIIDNDMDPPYVNGQVPAPQSNVNPPLNSIVFHCRDDDKGVNRSTIVFSCTGNGNPIPGTLGMDYSDIHNIICTFTPNTPIPGGICVLCKVHSGLADGLGNATTSDITWWFTVGANKVRTNSLGELKAIFHE
jgi:hypothetical protein